MQPQVKAEICIQCKGKGLLPNGKPCDNCRGIGFIGTDGVYEYYLADDGRGNLRVVDIKSQIGSSQPQKSNGIKLDTQKKSVIRGLVLVLTIILYVGFIGLYLTWIKDIRVFWTVTIITIGLVIMFFLYDAKLINKLVNSIINIAFKEPEDFLNAVKKMHDE